jgi:putative ABC transport system substrate-binding protein
MSICLRRREFIAGLGGAAAAWPLAVRAQQRGRMPVVGVLSQLRFFPGTAFQQGLADAGFVIGKNVAIEFRKAELGQQLPALAADLVQRRVDVIFAFGSVRAAKSATTTIPIVFFYGGDPVKDGLVSSLARPGGNVTGVTDLTSELTPKRVGILHELVPDATTIGLLTGVRGSSSDDVLAAAHTFGLDVIVFPTRSNVDLERAFVTFVERRVGALIVDNNDSLLIDYGNLIISLAERYKIPAMYFRANSVRNGGLISYHAAFSEGIRKAAAQYVGPILKGAKPADLPVQQPVKFELEINLKTANALGINVPYTLLAIADEVIE